ncbi:hypothetical protein A3A21_02095 [Candidatus Jorgensenbacteria bacterium RIFCSPLOWO2_01_FULL_45_25b]|uniref:Uncharacterized protein n=1 Tax=Candidatus Jorgensenbacteria bacterium RIFCSPLOWO2_01_FULL_45_25b TaxID=1798471 RepID=A0A1F6BZA3_9BACT|nr:MAG: hypothetical protein A3A21_02095 [Candidatus Jorgensenbacteria bacterium RIFCSPLOWO2_01_FULL_45_25b]
MEKTNNTLTYISIVIALFFIGAAVIWGGRGESVAQKRGEGAYEEPKEEEVILPITWGAIGSRLVSEGVIDKEKWNELYVGREEEKAEALTWLEPTEERITMTKKNANTLLNILWAFGLANKNQILEEGEMMDKEYGGAGNFASTGGWTLAKGDAMEHYSTHRFVELNESEQNLVARVAGGIYRPCCGNSTHFPDCNHGMAMLGLLELMAKEGVSEKEMYEVALKVNSLWFPGVYENIAEYMQLKNIEQDPQKMLGYDFSSASGYRNVQNAITPKKQEGGGGCGV